MKNSHRSDPAHPAILVARTADRQRIAKRVDPSREWNVLGLDLDEADWAVGTAPLYVVPAQWASKAASIPEVALWVEVVMQAARDLSHPEHCAAALRWFRSADFELVAAWVGLAPEAVRRRIAGAGCSEERHLSRRAVKFTVPLAKPREPRRLRSKRARRLRKLCAVAGSREVGSPLCGAPEPHPTGPNDSE